MPQDDDNALAILRLAWRLDTYDDWRVGVDARLQGLDHEIGKLVKADEIATAVTAQLRRDRAFGLTVVGKLGIVAFALGSPVASALILKAIGG